MAAVICEVSSQGLCDYGDTVCRNSSSSSWLSALILFVSCLCLDKMLLMAKQKLDRYHTEPSPFCSSYFLLLVLFLFALTNLRGLSWMILFDKWNSSCWLLLDISVLSVSYNRVVMKQHYQTDTMMGHFLLPPYSLLLMEVAALCWSRSQKWVV